LTQAAFGTDGAEGDVALLVTQLRRKLEPDPHSPCYLLAVGVGDFAFDPRGGCHPDHPTARDREPQA
jgi:hypothetical protein